MRYISLFAGIGGFDLALNRLGHTCVYANEWDKYAAQTYEKNFSHRPDTTDIRLVRAYDIPDHDLLVGGFPCQAFSVAGKRGGFEDTRGTLFFEIARILRNKRPRYFILENVKGLLSHDGGKTFSTILGVLADLGYEYQWQVLNSKDYGVPQNRERVFIVGHLRGTPRPEVFPITNSNGSHFSETENAESERERLRGQDISSTIDANYHKGAGSTRQFIAQRIPLKFLDRNQRSIEGDYAYTIDSANTGGVMVGTLRTHKDGRGFRQMKSGVAPTLPARAREDGSGQGVILKDTIIRRLTPIECERLQGFPDNWTAGVSDTQRYKQLGNAVTVNVVYGVAKRLCK